MLNHSRFQIPLSKFSLFLSFGATVIYACLYMIVNDDKQDIFSTFVKAIPYKLNPHPNIQIFLIIMMMYKLLVLTKLSWTFTKKLKFLFLQANGFDK